MKVKFGEVCILQRGQSITKKDIIDGDVPVIAGGKQPAYYHNKANREKNIITISSSGANAGYVNFWTVPIFCSDSFTVKPKDDNQFIIRYLYYFLKSRQEYLYSLSRGCGIPHVYSADIAPFEIELVDIQTQKEIVAVLDKVTSLISMRKGQLEKLDILVKSKFIEMFGDPVLNPKGWEKKKLGEVCSSIVRGPFGSALKKEYFVPYNAGVYKVYEQKNAIKQDSNIGSYYISEEKFLSLKRFECKTGDIIMSCSGTVGKMYTLPENAHQGIINQALMKMTLNGVVIDNIFKIYFGLAVENLVLNGSGIKNISSVSYLKNIDIQVPPLDLQNQFAEFVEQVEKNKENIKSSLNQLEILYNALMQEYFG